MRNATLLLVLALLYVNYRMFRMHLQAVFWAATYATLLRQFTSTRLKYFFPVLQAAALFPALSLVLFSSALLCSAAFEAHEYITRLLPLLGQNKLIHPHVDECVRYVLMHAVKGLGFKRHEAVSEGMVYWKIMDRSRELASPILQSAGAFAGFVFHFLFFASMLSYFTSLEKNPLAYAMKPFGEKGDLVTRSYESIVQSLFWICAFNFTAALSVSYLFGTPLCVTNALLATGLSVFPVLPKFIYAIPSALLFLAEGSATKAAGFFAVGVLLFLVHSRFYKFSFTRDCVKALSVALGMSTFGAPGVVLGPLAVSSLLILWPGSPVIAEPRKVRAPNEFMSSRSPR